MKIWAKTKEFFESKFLVVRRDGTVPDWPYFVLGARDPVAAHTLRSYAAHARAHKYDPEYCDSVRELADDFDAYREKHGDGDPDAGPHREDNEAILALMRHEDDLQEYTGPPDQQRR